MPPADPANLDEVAASLLLNPETDDQEPPTPKDEQATLDAEDAVADHEAPDPDAGARDDIADEVDADADTEEAEYLDPLDDLLPEYDDEPEPEPQPAGDGDDHTHAVRVDGETVEVSLAELKRAYALGGATMNRLNEATQARNTAREEGLAEAQQQAAQILAHAQQQAEALRQVYEQHGQALFAPRVAQPDPAMQQTDPLGYLNAANAYRDDQDRIAREQAELQEVNAQAETIRQQRVAYAKQVEAQKLRSKIPALADAEKAQAYSQVVYEGARGVGFSDEEIAQGVDHRLYMMAAKAAAYDRLRGGKQTTTPGKRRVARRAMKPGGGQTTKRVKRTINKQRQEKARDRARKTGTVEDVAATLY
jgi:hypothetical protein